jgi:hypothetical protein
LRCGAVTLATVCVGKPLQVNVVQQSHLRGHD